MDDLAPRLAHRVQSTRDGRKPYLEAIEDAFGGDIDYAMLIEHYGAAPEQSAARRYSPAECTGISVKSVGAGGGMTNALYYSDNLATLRDRCCRSA